MKRILIIIPSLGGGGAERVLIDILNRFDYTKYNVELLVIHYYGPYINQINHNVTIHRIFNGPSTLISRVVTKAERLLSVHDIINKCKVRKLIKDTYDTIISFTTNEALYYHSYLFNKAKKNINWVHVDVEKNHNHYPFSSHRSEVAAYEHIDQLIFVSNDSQRAFNKVFDCINAAQTVIYNLIDNDAIERKSKEENIHNRIPTIITIGRIIPIKGFERLIQVARKMKEDGLVFQIQILGTGPLLGHLEYLAKREGVEGVVFFLGFKSNPYPYLKAADIFISTSLSEAFSLAVCESLCLGKAIVCTRTTGPIEILQNTYGILTTHDVNDIYLKLKELLTDPALIAYYQGKAIERSAMFDPKFTMNEIYKVI